MELTDVIVCSPGTTNTGGVVTRHWLPGYTPDAGVVLSSSAKATCSSDGTKTIMSFLRPIKASGGAKEVEIKHNQDVHVLAAWGIDGTIGSTGAWNQHSGGAYHQLITKFVVTQDSTKDTTPTPGGDDDGGTTNVAPSPAKEELSAIEKELRVEGLEKFETLDPSDKLGMTWTLNDDSVEVAVKTKGLNGGWISIAFPPADSPSLMSNADAVSGDAGSVQAWKLGARDIASQKGSDFLKSSSVEVVGDYMTFRFKVSTGNTKRRLLAVSTFFIFIFLFLVFKKKLEKKNKKLGDQTRLTYCIFFLFSISIFFSFLPSFLRLMMTSPLHRSMLSLLSFGPMLLVASFRKVVVTLHVELRQSISSQVVVPAAQKHQRLQHLLRC